MKRLVTTASHVARAHLNGYHIDGRWLDGIMIQVADKGSGNFEVSFLDRDQRFLSQFPAAQHAEWLNEAMLHVESGSPLETLDGKPAWIADEAPRQPKSYIKAMRPARQEPELPPGLEFLQRT